MKAKVDAETCIGCKQCVDACPEVFEMKDDKAVVKANPVPPAAEDCAREAEEICPVDAISIEA